MAKTKDTYPKYIDYHEAITVAEKLLAQEKAKAAKPKPYGVYLNNIMRADLEKIAAQETGGNFHALLQYAVKYFIQEYNAGRIKIKKTTQTKLEL